MRDFKVRIAPSILSADFGAMREAVLALQDGGADWIHFDVMDGHLETVRHILPAIDLLLIMTVNPGFGGQAFIELMKPKIVEARLMIEQSAPHVLLEVDGGVSPENARELVELGARVLVAGSSVFHAPTPQEGVRAGRRRAPRDQCLDPQTRRGLGGGRGY